MRKARIQILETFRRRIEVSKLMKRITILKQVLVTTIQVSVTTIRVSVITILNRVWDTQMKMNKSKMVVAVNRPVICLIIDVYIFES